MVNQTASYEITQYICMPISFYIDHSDRKCDALYEAKDFTKDVDDCKRYLRKIKGSISNFAMKLTTLSRSNL